MNTELAYLLGLLIGGGVFGRSDITIDFPYEKWPHEDVEIAPQWFNDSITNIAPMINRVLNAQATPNYVKGTTPRFYIHITNIPHVTYDTLRAYGINPVGELRRCTSLQGLLPHMDQACKRAFVSGLADVIGSVRASHRHRSLASTIVSFEIMHENWSLPYELCQLLYELNVPVDQILWSHPNIQSGKNSTYRAWRKGHKVRVKAGDFATIGFGLECKRRGLEDLIHIEERNRGCVSHNSLCPNQKYSCAQCNKVAHVDEDATDLPPEVRGHFIHYTHICSVLGCPHAPANWLSRMIQKYGRQSTSTRTRPLKNFW